MCFEGRISYPDHDNSHNKLHMLWESLPKTLGELGAHILFWSEPSVCGRSPPCFGALHVHLFLGAVWDGSRSLVWAAALPTSFSLAAPATPKEEPPGPQQLQRGCWRQDPRAVKIPGGCEHELVPPGLGCWFLWSWLEIGEICPSGRGY